MPRWATFPAFAFGWKVNEEKFLKNVHWLDELKLRLGYGKTGQQDINNNYAYFASYNENINSTNGRYPLVGVNPSGVMSRPDAYNQDLKFTTTFSPNYSHKRQGIFYATGLNEGNDVGSTYYQKNKTNFSIFALSSSFCAFNIFFIFILSPPFQIYKILITLP